MRYGLKKYQRGALFGTAGIMMGSAAVNTDVLTYTTKSIYHLNEGSVATAALRFNSDGSIEKREGATYTTLNSGTEWIDGFDTSSAGDYEIKVEGSKSGSGTLTGATGFWLSLDTNREWKVVSTSGQTCGFSGAGSNVEIREKLNTSNSVSASLSLTADGLGI